MRVFKNHRSVLKKIVFVNNEKNLTTHNLRNESRTHSIIELILIIFCILFGTEYQ